LFESKKKPPECKKKSKEIVDRSALASEFGQLMDQIGITVLASSPSEFQASLKAETARWDKVIKASGVKPE
jgi:tripartite-type tricarboxylate transporter receptor subunit TctC